MVYISLTELLNQISVPDFPPTSYPITALVHISRTFGSKRENQLATLCFKSDVYNGLRLRYFPHPQISLLTTPSPATMFCVPPTKKLKVADAVCNMLADVDF
ncbi:hypothetical protein [Nostoc sp. CALU 1950]|uniref:hypothetical protein n=1 Tax=Nostoc sp. CALU 1950 TaxID=3104321 RepID=UPI003EC0D189